MVTAATARALDSTSTYQISDPGGGDCSLIGNWDAGSKTCTLNSDVSFSDVDGIHIDSDGVTLDGNGHVLTGGGTIQQYGVFLSNRSGVIIKNLTIVQFDYGIVVRNSSSNTLSDNSFASNTFFSILLETSSNNILSGNNISNDYGGIMLDSSSSNTITGNSIVSSGGKVGISLYYSDANNLTGNLCYDHWAGIGSSAWEAGISLEYSNANLVTANTLKENWSGIRVRWSGDNTIFRNNFVLNLVQVEISGVSTGNIFSLPTPEGGNYWGDIPGSSSWVCDDTSPADGFCDLPYIFSGGQDDLPLTEPKGCYKANLSIRSESVYWDSYAAYLDRQLSIDYRITNKSSDYAYQVKIVTSSATNGVTLATAIPQAVGTLAGDSESAAQVLKYAVPMGVTSFRATVYASSGGACGNDYEYPGPTPGA